MLNAVAVLDPNAIDDTSVGITIAVAVDGNAPHERRRLYDAALPTRAAGRRHRYL
jgi:hypothetical protein